MSHEVHTTDALVLRRAPAREADAVVWLLTEDFGMIPAVAQSVREERSKMRFALQELTHSRVSVVRGREIWRVTGAESKHAYTSNVTLEQKEMLGRVAALLSRLVPSEDTQLELFDICNDGFLYATKIDDENTLALLELVIVARVLNELGYMTREGKLNSILSSHDINGKVIEEAKKAREVLVNDINVGLAESQL